MGGVRGEADERRQTDTHTYTGSHDIAVSTHHISFIYHVFVYLCDSIHTVYDDLYRRVLPAL